MKKVKFLTDTAYQGPRKEGDIVDVPDDFADRWVKNGIAEIISGSEANKQEKDEEVPEKAEEVVEKAEEVVEADEEVVDYSKMNAKELYALCKERGIEVEAKKAKDYYIEKLTVEE